MIDAALRKEESQMRTVTSKKYLMPETVGTLIKLTPKAGGREPEFMKAVKYVDTETNQVYFFNGNSIDPNAQEPNP